FPTVAVKVCGQHTHGPAGIAHSRAVGHIGEGTVAVIMVERAPRTLWVGSRFHSERVREINVEAAILVVIEQGDSTAHRFHNVFLRWSGNVSEVDTRRVGDIREVCGWACFRRSEECSHYGVG